MPAAGHYCHYTLLPCQAHCHSAIDTLTLLLIRHATYIAIAIADYFHIITLAAAISLPRHAMRITPLPRHFAT